MKIGKNSLKYIIDTEKDFDAQKRNLDKYLPWFFKENSISTDSDISAEAISSNEIELRPLGNNNKFWAFDKKYNEPWKTKYGANIISETIEGIRFTLYDMK